MILLNRKGWQVTEQSGTVIDGRDFIRQVYPDPHECTAEARDKKPTPQASAAQPGVCALLGGGGPFEAMRWSLVEYRRTETCHASFSTRSSLHGGIHGIQGHHRTCFVPFRFVLHAFELGKSKANEILRSDRVAHVEWRLFIFAHFILH